MKLELMVGRSLNRDKLDGPIKLSPPENGSVL